MFQKQRLFVSGEELTEEGRIQDFIVDFMNYYGIIKQYVPNDVKQVIEICKELYELYTKPFFEKWSDLNLLEWHSDYEKNYYSFLFVSLNSKMILPHRILIYETLSPQTDLLDQLKKAKDPKIFFWRLNKICRGLNLPLLWNDIKIIYTFLDPVIRNKIVSIPTNRQIAEILGCSENTISRRLDLITNKMILSQVYKIDMARIGYQSSAIIHFDNFNDCPPKMGHYCLSDVPIDWGEEIAKIKIFQVPYDRKDIMGEIKDHFNSLYDITLTRSYMGWNLSGLTPEIDNRWKIFPPIFLGESWTDPIISEGAGIEKNLFNDMTEVKLSQTQVKMLDLLQIEAKASVHLAQTLNVTPKYIKQYYDYFHSQNIISRFSILGHLGLDSKVWITLLGTKSDDFKKLSSIVEHLKCFPFSYLFYNEKNLDNKGRPLLAGLIWIPSSWFIDFYGAWIHLIEDGFVPKINICQGVIKWGIDIYKTYNVDKPV
ncbi:MAG: hypothetical protein ACXAC8_13680 [Candidatus Hodarchaeales archaeon]